MSLDLRPGCSTVQAAPPGSTSPTLVDPAFLLLCEGEDSNLHASYPTSTSRGSPVENIRVCEAEERRSTPIDPSERIPGGRVPQAAGAPDDLASEARALLRLAALREDIPVERARAFAAAVLAERDVGRWALAVLRGEPHAARALVELAKLVHDAIRLTSSEHVRIDSAGPYG